MLGCAVGVKEKSSELDIGVLILVEILFIPLLSNMLGIGMNLPFLP